MTATQTRQALFFIPGMPPDKAQARYRALTKVLHPDTPTGDNRLMQLLNLEYEALARGLLLAPAETESAPHPTDPIGDYFEGIRRKAHEMIRYLPQLSGVTYEIDTLERCIVALGKSYEHKEYLKVYGFRWAPERKAWIREVLL